MPGVGSQPQSEGQAWVMTGSELLRPSQPLLPHLQMAFRSSAGPQLLICSSEILELWKPQSLECGT